MLLHHPTCCAATSTAKDTLAAHSSTAHRSNTRTHTKKDAQQCHLHRWHQLSAKLAGKRTTIPLQMHSQNLAQGQVSVNLIHLAAPSAPNYDCSMGTHRCAAIRPASSNADIVALLHTVYTTDVTHNNIMCNITKIPEDIAVPHCTQHTQHPHKQHTQPALKFNNRTFILHTHNTRTGMKTCMHASVMANNCFKCTAVHVSGAVELIHALFSSC